MAQYAANCIRRWVRFKCMLGFCGSKGLPSIKKDGLDIEALTEWRILGSLDKDKARDAGCNHEGSGWLEPDVDILIRPRWKISLPGDLRQSQPAG